MIPWITENVPPLLLAFSVGLFGWIVTNFIAGPILRFYRVREETLAALFFFGNVGSREHDDKILNEAQNSYRRLAASFNAINSTALWPAKFWFGIRKYDLQQASHGLVGFSNTFWKKGEPALHRSKVEIGLKFQRSYSDDALKGIAARLDSGFID